MGFVSREEEIYVLRAALAAAEHVAIIGPPGTAKTLMARRIAELSGLKFFSIQMTPGTTPEMVFGPWSLKALKEDRLEREAAEYALDAQVVLVDEFSNGTEATLHELFHFMAYREGKIRHPHWEKVPLRTLIATSNNVPGRGLEALWDRFLFRHITGYVSRDMDTIRKLIQLDGPDVEPVPIVDPDTVNMPKSAVDALAMLVLELHQRGIVVSDRRIVWATKALKASAILDGRDTVEERDLEILRFVFWEDASKYHETAQLILQLVNPGKASAQALVRDVETAFGQINPNDPQTLGNFMAVAGVARQKLVKIVERDKSLSQYLERVDRLISDAAGVIKGGRP